MPAVDIVVVNWNSGALLRQCVRSIAEQGGDHVARVIVVDNGSVDGSAEIAAPSLDLEIVLTGANLGFGKACNLGARRGQAPYVLFFNPDAEMRPDGLDRALAFMAAPENARVGVCGVKLVDEHGHIHRHCARFPTWRNFIGNSLGLTRLLKRWFPPILMTDFDHLSSRRVDHVMGAFYLMRRELFEAIHGFDEHFFVYLEDLDLSRRVYDAGYTIQYLAEATAYHKQGGTSESVKAHRLFYALKSNIVYAFKHFARGAALPVILVTLLLEPFSRSMRAVFRMSVDEFVFTWQGFAMLYRDLGNIVSTLKAIAAGRRGAR